ncbi:hypothetical protein [Burkholderia sp. L27(2015)]|uniref:hypothetical protein n=1 Tax=Burkholderia sp. L27(2015) TaxID=1641858 RepID=UPI00131E3558|nr:hypothetical protein [Burkholderia sp. L27(2015)]
MVFSQTVRTGAFAALMLLGLTGSATAQVARGQAASNATAGLDTPSSELVVTPGFSGDDPSAVRDTFIGKENGNGANGGAPSSTRSHIKEWVGKVLPSNRTVSALLGDNPGRELAFVAPVSRGILYSSTTHIMKVDVSFSDESHPDDIILRRVVSGPDGQKLTFAAQAKSEGFVQTIDLIDIQAAGKRDETTVHGRFALSSSAFAQADGNLAVVFICRVVPPYLTEQHSHRDATDDEPTDITTRTSTLHVAVDDIWLIDQTKGVVIEKGLRLTK